MWTNKWFGRFLLAAVFLGTLSCPDSSKGDQYVWTNIGTGMGTNVHVLTLGLDDSLYAGGSFTNAGAVAASRAAVWRGVSWTNFGSGLGDDVRALALDYSENLYVGGLFTNAGGVAVNHIAMWDGSSWTNIGEGLGSNVYALLVLNPVAAKKILVSEQSETTRPAMDGTIDTIVVAAGSFTNAGGLAATNIAMWRGTYWTNFGGGVEGEGRCLVMGRDGNLYMGGKFASVGATMKVPVIFSGVAIWDGTQWTNFEEDVNGAVNALAVSSNGDMYAGGEFVLAGGVTVNHVAKWNGSTWTNLGVGVNNNVNALAFGSNGDLFVGGSFTEAGGNPANHVAVWNGSSWSAVGSGMNTSVYALMVSTNGRTLYAGGCFTSAGGVAASYVAMAQLQAGSTGAIGLSTNFLSYTGYYNGSAPAAKGFYVTNNGSGAFSYTTELSYSSLGSGWFTVTPNTGYLGVGSSVMSSGSVNLATLNAGSYLATCQVSSADASNSPQELLALLVVNRATQALNFVVGANQNLTNTVYLGATASSGLPVTTFIVASGPGTITDTNVLTFSATGLVSVVAQQAGNTNWELVAATQAVAVGVGLMSINPSSLTYTGSYHGANPSVQTFVVSNIGGAGFSYTNTVGYGAGGSGWFVPTPGSGSAAVASGVVNSGAVNIASLSVGTYLATCTLWSAGATNAPLDLNVTLVVGKGVQTITFPTIGQQNVTNTVVLYATANSGLGITFAVVSGPGVITDGTNLTFSDIGWVSIGASQAGDDSWLPASASNTFRVVNQDPPGGLPASLYLVLLGGKKDQTVYFAEIGTQRVHTLVHLNATATSGLPVSFSVDSGAAVMVGTDSICLVSTGEVCVVASQGGDEEWVPAIPVTNCFLVIP